MEQSFDGLEVAVFEGKLTGTFDLPHDVGAGMGIFDDQEYIFTVVATPKSASFGQTKAGDPKRTNTLQVVAVQYEGERNGVVSLQIPASRSGLPLEPEPVIGIDSLDGQLDIESALSEEPEVEDEEEFVQREPSRAPIPVGGGGPIRTYDHDPALKNFLG